MQPSPLPWAMPTLAEWRCRNVEISISISSQSTRFRGWRREKKRQLGHKTMVMKILVALKHIHLWRTNNISGSWWKTQHTNNLSLIMWQTLLCSCYYFFRIYALINSILGKAKGSIRTFCIPIISNRLTSWWQWQDVMSAVYHG